MREIQEEIILKKNKYIKKYSKKPKMLCMPMCQYLTIMDCRNYYEFVGIDFESGKVLTIFGMPFTIDDSLAGIRLQ